MNLRLIKFWLALMFYSGLAHAAGSGAWDCEQTKNGEWTCLNQAPANPEQAAPQIAKPQATQSKPQVAQQAEPMLQAKPQPPPQEVQTQAVSPNPSIQQAPTQEGAKTAPTTAEEREPEKTAEKLNEPKSRIKVTQNQQPHLKKVEPVREPLAASPKQSGWTCQSGGGEQNWNCNLVGADPKGEAQAVADTQPDSNWLTPSFDHNQEQLFQTLRAEFKQDPWLNCENWSIKKPKKKAFPHQSRENAVTDVTADSSEAFEGEVLTFAGNVDLTRADQHLLADKASYDTVAGVLDAQGNVIYSEGSIAFAGDTASMNLNSNEARLRNVSFINGDGPLRGRAGTVYRDNEYLSRYNETSFTSCAPGNQDWMMHASRLKINRDSGQGSAKDVWMEFKGVPVLYTPYISFPTDNRRLTGFLPPFWGNTQRAGFYAAAPFYWNIAPNIDTTITPQYFSGRGEMLTNHLRYLTETSKGSFAAQYMPNDRVLNKSRYSLNFSDTSTLTSNLNAQINVNRVSDKTFFNDLNSALAVQRSSVLPSTASLNYARQDAAFSANINSYQLVDPTLSSTSLPYALLPRLALNLNHSFEDIPLKIGMDSQYSSFYRSPTDTAQRMVLWPSIATPIQSSAGFFIPKMSMQSTFYQLNNKQLPGEPSSIDRTLPVFSVDTGLSFEKPMDFAGAAYNNIIEPRLFYLYIPRRNQNAIPIFDTTAYDPNFNSLFRENSYSGFDRLQDANQITLAATTRYVDSTTGLEPLKVSLGQILYFQDRTVTLNSNYPSSVFSYAYSVPVQNSKTSNLVSEVSGQITEQLSYTTGAQWNTEADRIARTQAGLRYRNQPDAIFDIGYRFRSASANPLVAPTVVPGTSTLSDISLTDVSFRWPLLDQWHALARWQYSLNFDKTLESFIGLEKENCCWRFRILGRRFINGATYNTNIANPNLTPETTYFVELELKGLSGMADNFDNFLQSTLNGYRPAGSY